MGLRGARDSIANPTQSHDARHELKKFHKMTTADAVRPNKQAFQQKMKEFQLEIKQCHDRISAIKPVTVDEKAKAERDLLKAQFRNLLDEKKVQVAKKAMLKKEFMALVNKQPKKPATGQNLAELEKSVAQIESIKEQERMLTMISNMKMQAREHQQAQVKIASLKAEMDAIDIKSLDSKLDKCKTNMDLISEKLKETFEQRAHVGEEKKEIFSKMDQLKKEKDELYQKFIESERLYNEQKRIEAEKEKQLEKLEKAQLEVEDAQITAFSAEIALVDALISHFKNYRGKKLVLDFQSIEQLTLLGLEFPKSVKQLPELLESLEAKKKEYEQNSEKQTLINLEKANAKLEKLKVGLEQ